MSIVAELQHEALDEKTSVTSLLRKALVVANKLEHADTAKWIEHELKGYRDGKAAIPAYRHLRGIAQVFNPYRGYIPLEFNSVDLADRANALRPAYL